VFLFLHLQTFYPLLPAFCSLLFTFLNSFWSIIYSNRHLQYLFYSFFSSFWNYKLPWNGYWLQKPLLHLIPSFLHFCIFPPFYALYRVYSLLHSHCSFFTILYSNIHLRDLYLPVFRFFTLFSLLSIHISFTNFVFTYCL
jgi:hypothetical protein